MDEMCFKKCTGCGQEWTTQKQFIEDKDLTLNGYKADFERLEYGMFFFTHKKDGCFSTIVIEVSQFMNLFKGQRFIERKTDTDECPRYCSDDEQLVRCEAMCECAFVREIMHVLLNGSNS